MFQPSPARTRRQALILAQSVFNKGYVSTLADSRIPKEGLSDMTNITLDQDGLPRPRPSLQPYGGEMLGECIGIGTFIKIVDGLPERWMISMQVVSVEVGSSEEDFGRIHIAKDGGDWELVDHEDNLYDPEARAQFTQSNNRVYVSNQSDTMSYYDIESGDIVIYEALSTPSTPSAVKTGLSGTDFTYYYRVSANNNVGESAASASDSETVGKVRDQWIPASDYITVSWSAVTGATSYNVYVGDSSGSEYYLATVTSLSFRDDGSLAPNPFKIAPAGNSTAGPTLEQLYNRNSQLFGCGDIDNPYYLWYSGTGEQSGDFSPFNGGGYVGIDFGGETLPAAVRSFRDGRGNPVLTVLSRGSAGGGKVYHVSFDNITIGDTTITFPNVYEAGGQSGTISPFGVVEANNSLYYPTGTSFKTTGTKPNLLNILSTDSISQGIEPDVRRLNLSAMEKCVGIEYEGKIYWSLPFGSENNSEIWILDLTRRGAWILRWTVPAKFMWTYEDNSGGRHFCVLVDNKVMEFTTDIYSADDSVPFYSRVAGGASVFDEAGVALAYILASRFKFLYPRGTISIRVHGLREDGNYQTLVTKEFIPGLFVALTGYGQYQYSDGTQYGADVGFAENVAKALDIIPLEVDETVNEIKWEIVTEEANCDYILSAVQVQGIAIPKLYYGDDQL